MSVVFAIGAGCTLAATSWTEGWWARWWWLAAAALVQLRLLANMLDGMVAIESGKESRLGQLFNEVPDRLSDAAILIGVGYSTGGSPVLGYLAALMALLVAYVRAMGGVAGAGQVFTGPMAKPQRMFLVTIVCLYCGLTSLAWQPMQPQTGMGLTAAALAVILLGGSLTAVRRLLRIASLLKEQAP